MRNNKLWKVFSFIIAATFIVVCIYLMIGSGSSMSILKSYDAVKPDSTSGFSKQLMFVESYTRVTKDTTLAQKLGISEEDAEDMANGGTLQDQGDGGTSGKETFASGRTEADLKTALDNRKANEGNVGEYFQIGAGYKIVTFDNSAYLVEVQSNGKWPVFNGYDKKGNRLTVDSVGCYMFACSTAINALNNSTVSIADIMKEMRPSASNYSYSSSSHTWTGSMTDVGQGVDSECKGVFESRGLSYGTISTGNITGTQAKDKMLQSGFNNTVYIIYGHKSGVISSGDNHWVVCIGADDDYLYVLNNSSRGVSVKLSDLSSSGSITTIIKVSK